jgi:hypothetical protein
MTMENQIQNQQPKKPKSETELRTKKMLEQMREEAPDFTWIKPVQRKYDFQLQFQGE